MALPASSRLPPWLLLVPVSSAQPSIEGREGAVRVPHSGRKKRVESLSAQLFYPPFPRGHAHRRCFTYLCDRGAERQRKAREKPVRGKARAPTNGYFVSTMGGGGAYCHPSVRRQSAEQSTGGHRDGGPPPAFASPSKQVWCGRGCIAVRSGNGKTSSPIRQPRSASQWCSPIRAAPAKRRRGLLTLAKPLSRNSEDGRREAHPQLHVPRRT